MISSTVLTVQIDNGNIRATDNTSLAHDQTQTSRTTRDDSTATLQAEGRQRPPEMEATAALDWSGAWEVLLLWVLDTDALIRPRELTLMLEGTGLAGGAVLVVLVLVLLCTS